MAGRFGDIAGQQHSRLWVQLGGPTPLNKLRFAAQDTNFAILQGATNPNMGDITPVNVYDPYIPGGYVNAGETIGPPEAPSWELVMYEKLGGSVSWGHFDQRCFINLYEVVGSCRDLGDPTRGWDYIMVYSHGRVQSRDGGDRMAFEPADRKELTLPMQGRAIYPVGQMFFSPGAQIVRTVANPVVDATFATQSNCGDCGYLPNDGTGWIYGVTSGELTGPTAPQVIYSITGGNSWVTAAISGTPAITAGTAIKVVGNYLVVLGGHATGSGWWYGTLGPAGAPGTAIGVTTGFPTMAVSDMHVAGGQQVIVVGAGGKIFRSSSVPDGVESVLSPTTQNLTKISGFGDTIVAVGAAGTIVVSNDRGASWSLANSPTVSALLSVAVLDANRWWVGAGTGQVWYTLNGGSTWFLRSVGLTANVNVIKFATNEVGYCLGSGKLVTTWDGGVTWMDDTSPRLRGLPTFGSGQALAVPQNAGNGLNANTLIVAGLGSNSLDSVMYPARTNIF